MSLTSLEEARQKGNCLLERCRAGLHEVVLQKMEGYGSALSGVGAGTANVLSKQQGLTMAAEQYRHNIGWTHAIIRTIAQRVADQPVRVARPIARDEVRRLVGMIQKGSRTPSWQKDYASQILGRVRKMRLSRARQPRFVREWMGKGQGRELQVIEDHPILRAIERPNPLMVRWILLYVTLFHLELTGRCYWWFTREDQLHPGALSSRIQIWPLPTSWVEPIHEADRLFAYWQITPPGGGSNIKIPGHQIAQLYYPEPSNPLGCLSPLQAQSRAVVVDEATLEAQRRGFSNGTFPGMAVIVGRLPDAGGIEGQTPVLTREQRAQIMTAFKQSYRGIQNAEEPVILDGLIKDVRPITTNPKEMAFLETSKTSKERLTQGYGVNPVSMGQLEGANRASSRMADGHLVANAINPKVGLISECLTSFLPPIFADEEGATGDELVYLEKAVTIDEDLERENIKCMAEQGAISRNEIRQTYGRPPIKGGDTCFVPLNSGLVEVQHDETVLFDQGELTDDIGTPGEP